jgi:signal transduction histidine kinase
MADPTLSRAVTRIAHDLRQPLQTLHILIDLLRRRVQGTEALELVERQEIAVNALAALLDEIDKALDKE